MLDRFEHDQGAHRGCPLFYRRVGPPTRSPAPVHPPGTLSGPEAREQLTDQEAVFIVGKVTPTEKERLILARIGQGAFRSSLISQWGACSVSGAGLATVLVASHIVPWCKCVTNAERLDPFNGLLLTPNLDKLFDRGLISFSADGKVRISRSLSKSDALALGIHSGLKLRRVPEQSKGYLARHVSEGYFRP